LKPKDASKDNSEFVEAEITLIQYILFTLEEIVIHHCSKPEDHSMLSNPSWFRPPTDNPHRHHRKEEEAPHLYTEDNKSKD
jgi:hypothetical protein